MMRSKISIPIALAALLAAPAPAAAADPAPGARGREASDSSRQEDAPAPADGAPRFDLVRLNAGVKVGYVPNRAFDTFADSDTLAQFSIDGTYPVLTRGRLVLAAGLGWDAGGRSDGLRGQTSSISTNRFAVPLEARYHVVPTVYAFGKLAPGAAMVRASVYDGTTPGEMTATGWAFAADASLGASVLLGSRRRLDQRGFRVWLTPELGYAFTTRASLALNAGRDENDVLGRDENTRLASVALSGFFWRASVGATF